MIKNVFEFIFGKEVKFRLGDTPKYFWDKRPVRIERDKDNSWSVYRFPGLFGRVVHAIKAVRE